MPPVARVGDPTTHPGVIAGPGIATVLVGGMPAAVLNDLHTCAFPPLAGPHPPNPIILGSATVSAGGMPLARVGDATGCGATIAMGCPNVEAGG